MTYYDITVGNGIVGDIYYDVTMSNDIVICTMASQGKTMLWACFIMY